MHVKINSIKDKPGFYTVVPDGPVDSESHVDFRSKLNPILNDKTRGILLDLSAVNYISSAGLGVLFSIKKILIQNNGELLFCGMRPQIKKLFEIVKALPKETVFTNAAEADKYFYAIMNEEIKKQKKS